MSHNTFVTLQNSRQLEFWYLLALGCAVPLPIPGKLAEGDGLDQMTVRPPGPTIYRFSPQPCHVRDEALAVIDSGLECG